LAVLPRWDRDFYYGYYLLVGCGARHIAAYERTMAAVKDTWLSRIEQRYATVLKIETPEHEVRRNLRLIEALGGTVTSDDLELWLSSEDHNRASEWLKSFGDAGSRRIIAFGIGASHSSRCWPEERFAELGRALASQYDARIILIGSGEVDRYRADAIMRLGRDLPMFSKVGALSLPQSVALLSRCDLFVGNDSGPLHLAAAAHIPVVEICGLPEQADGNNPSSPVRFGPWGRFTRVVRPPRQVEAERTSFSEPATINMEAVSVAAVRSAVADLLATLPTNSSALNGSPS
jgi:ADP-heptose:LPS heptosyltransferase